MGSFHPCSRPYLIWAFAIVLAMTTGIAHATFIERPTPYEQAAKAEFVFEGLVVDKWSEDFEREPSLAVTRVLIDVGAQYKGNIQSGQVVLTLPGGVRSDGVGISTPGTPSISINESVLIHGYSINEERIGLVNWSIGLLRMTTTEFGEPALCDAQGWLIDYMDPLEQPVYVGEYSFSEAVEYGYTEELEDTFLALNAVGTLTPDEVREIVMTAIAVSEGEGAVSTISGYPAN